MTEAERKHFAVVSARLRAAGRVFGPEWGAGVAEGADVIDHLVKELQAKERQPQSLASALRSLVKRGR